MMSTLCFALSAVCFVSMVKPRNSTKAKVERECYTYYVCDDEPMPTWQRKAAPRTLVAQRVG